MRITLNLDQYTFLKKEGALEKYKEQMIEQSQNDCDFSDRYERFINCSFVWPSEAIDYWYDLSILYQKSYKKSEELFTIEL